MANDYTIYVEPSMIGFKLTLKFTRTKKYVRWAVSDVFNGKSKDVANTESIYGFYTPGSLVTLYLYDKNNNCSEIKNVRLLKSESVGD